MLSMTIEEGYRRPLPFDLKVNPASRDLCKQFVQNVAFEETLLYKLISKNTRIGYKEAYEHLLTLNHSSQIIIRSTKTSSTYLHLLIDQVPATFKKYGNLYDLVPIIYELAFRGAIVNAQDKHGNTCLHLACLRPNAQSLCIHLLRIGADPCIPNHKGLKVVHSYHGHHFEIVKGESNVASGLWYAIVNEKRDLARKLLGLWCRTNIQKEDTLNDMANGFMCELLNDYSATNEMVCAAFSCNLDRLNKLINNQINRNLKDEAYRPAKPLIVSLGELGHWSKPVISRLIQAGFDSGASYEDEVLDYSLRFETTPFFKFLEEGSRKSLLRASKSLLKDGLDVHLVSSHPYRTNYTYLHYIVSIYINIVQDREEDARILIRIMYRLAQAGIDVNARNEEGETALAIAGKDEFANSLIPHLIRIGCDSTMATAEKASVCEEKMRVKGTLALKSKCSWKLLPGLWAALKRNDVDGMERWLKSLCRTRLVRGDRTITEIAASLGLQPMVRLLRKYEQQNEFACAVFASDKRRMYDLLVLGKAKEKSNLCDHYCNVAPPGSHHTEFLPRHIFISALELCTPEVLRYLINQGVDLHLHQNHVYPCGPLAMWAFMDHVNNKNTLVVAQLANVELRDEEGCTMLHRIVSKHRAQGRISVVNALLERGVPVAARDYLMRTARCYTTIYNYHENDKIRQMIDDHVLEMVSNNLISKLEHLQLWSYDNVTNIRGTRRMKTAHELAFIKQSKRMTTYLNKLPKMDYVRKQLILTTRAGNLAIVAKEIDEKNAYVRDLSNRSLLHNAILYNRVDVAQFLIGNYSRIINLQDNLGRTALHYCSMLENKYPIWNYLIEGSADLAISDYNYLTVKDYLNEIDKPTAFHLKPAGKRVKNYQPSRDLLTKERAFLEAEENMDKDGSIQTLSFSSVTSLSDAWSDHDGQVDNLGAPYFDEDELSDM